MSYRYRHYRKRNHHSTRRKVVRALKKVHRYAKFGAHASRTVVRYGALFIRMGLAARKGRLR